MNKFFIAIATITVFSFTSCESKKENTDQNVENTQQPNTIENDQVKADQENVEKIDDFIKDIPTFSSQEANEWVNKYAELAKEMKTAAEAEDQEKLNQLTKQAIDLSIESNKLTHKLTPEDAKKIKDWESEVQEALSK